jgi:hypothetical protein
MISEPTPSFLPELRDYVRRKVAAGFYSSAELVQMALDVFIDDASPEVLRPVVERLVAEAVEEHRSAAESWPPVTDCDRLDAAFEELNRAGIVARQDFSCCPPCGFAEIGDEITAAAETGLEVRGFAFYHFQSTEAAVEGLGLYLSYGALEEGEEEATRIGHELVHTLERHGLKTEWNGSPRTSVHIELDWKRRLPEHVGGLS